jgi:hypothetical protein
MFRGDRGAALMTGVPVAGEQVILGRGLAVGVRVPSFGPAG